MPSKSAKQQRLMRAVAHDPAFADKVGIPQKVGKDFVAADKAQDVHFAGGGKVLRRRIRPAVAGLPRMSMPPMMAQGMMPPSRAPMTMPTQHFAAGGRVNPLEPDLNTQAKEFAGVAPSGGPIKYSATPKAVTGPVGGQQIATLPAPAPSPDLPPVGGEGGSSAGAPGGASLTPEQAYARARAGFLGGDPASFYNGPGTYADPTATTPPSTPAATPLPKPSPAVNVTQTTPQPTANTGAAPKAAIAGLPVTRGPLATSLVEEPKVTPPAYGGPTDVKDLDATQPTTLYGLPNGQTAGYGGKLNFDVQNAYQNQMGRAADSSGLDYWRGRLAAGLSPDSLNQTFDKTQEGQDYNLAHDPLDDAMFARRAYKDILGRDPDPAAQQWLQNMLEQGIDRDTLVKNFILGSPEAQQRGLTLDPNVAAQWKGQGDPFTADLKNDSTEKLIAPQFERIMGRPPTDVELAKYANAMRAGKITSGNESDPNHLFNVLAKRKAQGWAKGGRVASVGLPMRMAADNNLPPQMATVGHGSPPPAMVQKMPTAHPRTPGGHGAKKLLPGGSPYPGMSATSGFADGGRIRAARVGLRTALPTAHPKPMMAPAPDGDEPLGLAAGGRIRAARVGVRTALPTAHPKPLLPPAPDGDEPLGLSRGGRLKPYHHLPPEDGGLPLNKGGWISGAIKHPGALHAQLGIPQGQTIPADVLAKAAHAPGKLGQRARLAQTLKGFADGGHVSDDDIVYQNVQPNLEESPPKGNRQAEAKEWKPAVSGDRPGKLNPVSGKNLPPASPGYTVPPNAPIVRGNTGLRLADGGTLSPAQIRARLAQQGADISDLPDWLKSQYEDRYDEANGAWKSAPGAVLRDSQGRQVALLDDSGNPISGSSFKVTDPSKVYDDPFLGKVAPGEAIKDTTHFGPNWAMVGAVALPAALSGLGMFGGGEGMFGATGGLAPEEAAGLTSADLTGGATGLGEGAAGSVPFESGYPGNTPIEGPSGAPFEEGYPGNQPIDTSAPSTPGTPPGGPSASPASAPSNFPGSDLDWTKMVQKYGLNAARLIASVLGARNQPKPGQMMPTNPFTTSGGPGMGAHAGPGGLYYGDNPNPVNYAPPTQNLARQWRDTHPYPVAQHMKDGGVVHAAEGMDLRDWYARMTGIADRNDPLLAEMTNQARNWASPTRREQYATRAREGVLSQSDAAARGIRGRPGIDPARAEAMIAEMQPGTSAAVAAAENNARMGLDEAQWSKLSDAEKFALENENRKAQLAQAGGQMATSRANTQDQTSASMNIAAGNNATQLGIANLGDRRLRDFQNEDTRRWDLGFGEGNRRYDTGFNEDVRRFDTTRGDTLQNRAAQYGLDWARINNGIYGDNLNRNATRNSSIGAGIYGASQLPWGSMFGGGSPSYANMPPIGNTTLPAMSNTPDFGSDPSSWSEWSWYNRGGRLPALQHRGGMMDPLNKGGRLPALSHRGGMTDTMDFRTGGDVSGPGDGTKDTVPAMLANGEVVINAEGARIADQLHPGLLDNLNAKGMEMRKMIASRGLRPRGQSVPEFGAMG